MSKQEWAKIVYGRSYHLDFRFITIPHDFSTQDLTWASQHILATTHRARKLPSNPRWSLFKNQSHCIVGVTCMVRDLIGQLGEELIEAMTKDDRGRPLYVFVGYVTQLNQGKYLLDIPAYTDKYLASFQSLYQEIEKIWLIKDYDRDSKKPLLSSYQSQTFAIENIIEHSTIEIVPQLNDQTKYPHKVFLWESSAEHNNQLWTATAKCLAATSVCLDTNSKQYPNSPFLNQTVAQLDSFKVKDRIVKAKQSPKNQNVRVSHSFSQIISNRAKEDLDATLQHAAKVAIASQELINNFSDWSNSESTSIKKISSPSNGNDDKNFGFKNKKSTPSSTDKDWF
ncbi:MAG: hypothetical protein QNJ53_16135 [Pleurocapsa sp. MO_192.B19]|nr:hypothetical protein [Pleurocapsa sp. MO_192.B19]